MNSLKNNARWIGLLFSVFFLFISYVLLFVCINRSERSPDTLILVYLLNSNIFTALLAMIALWRPSFRSNK